LALALALAFSVALRAWLCALRALRALRSTRQWEMCISDPITFATRTQLNPPAHAAAAYGQRMFGALCVVWSLQTLTEVHLAVNANAQRPQR
jgi:hypothetical protein